VDHDRANFLLGADADQRAGEYIQHYYGAECFGPARADTLSRSSGSTWGCGDCGRRLHPTRCSTAVRVTLSRSRCSRQPSIPPASARSYETKQEELMTIDLTAAADFMAGYARVLDRRRFELVTGQADNPAGALAALGRLVS
jgi:hypothetical protein